VKFYKWLCNILRREEVKTLNLRFLAFKVFISCECFEDRCTEYRIITK